MPPGHPHQESTINRLPWWSDQKTLIPKILEQGLGCSLTHGIFPSPSRASNHLGGHPRRAYNSSRNYPNALFIEGSQECRVPLLMSEGFYTFLILSLCTNDITNIRGFAHHIQLNWADQSARNTLVTAERAVRRFENLQVASLLPKIWSKVPGKHHYIVLKIFIISTPPTMQWLHVDDINEYFTKNGCICNNPIIQGHGNFQDLEISMTRERVRPWKFPSPMENSMAHGNFHARPYLSLDSRCLWREEGVGRYHYIITLLLPKGWLHNQSRLFPPFFCLSDFQTFQL